MAAVACSVTALLFTLQGCLKDSYRESYKIYTPVYQSLTRTRAEMKSSTAKPLENTGKLNVFGHYIFLNEVGKGIHVIDNSNPSAPRNLSFLPIPGNSDLAVKGNYLYADSYSDIAVFDISEPSNIRAVRFLDNVIKDKNRYWMSNQTNPDSIKVVVDYTARDTVISYSEYRRWSNCPNCMMASPSSNSFFYTSAPQVSVGGSMARFTIVNDYLYTVSNSELYTLTIADPGSPQQASSRQMGWNIETIYPFGNKLFIGSRNGMFIYSLSNPADPVQVGQFNHVTSCDPVIADNKFAYVTLRSGTTCNGTLNQLDVLNISNLSSPSLVKTVAMSNPHGLAMDGNRLLVCDGKAGLKLYDISSPENPKLLKQIQGLETYDVVALQGTAIVVAKDGLYQFSYSNNSLSQRSKLSISVKN